MASFSEMCQTYGIYKKQTGTCAIRFNDLTGGNETLRRLLTAQYFA